MINEEIADLFEKMARVLAFKDADPFRILAYERAALSLRDLKEDVASIAREGNLDDIPGIEHDLAEMIKEYLRLEDLKRVLDTGALLKLPGFGEKKTENLRRGWVEAHTVVYTWVWARLRRWLKPRDRRAGLRLYRTNQRTKSV
jgi:DNA polymerase/3'-5' exonuclease PolX